MLGTVNIRAQLDTPYQQRVSHHNKEVNKITMCLQKLLTYCIYIKILNFVGLLYLALRGHYESEESTNKGVFLSLIHI